MNEHDNDSDVSVSVNESELVDETVRLRLIDRLVVNVWETEREPVKDIEPVNDNDGEDDADEDDV